MRNVRQAVWLDTKDALERVNGREALWLELSHMFFDELDGYATYLRQLLYAETAFDAEALYDKTHHLKTSCAYLSATELHGLTRQLCRDIDRSGTADRELLKKLHDATIQTRKEILVHRKALDLETA